MRTGAFGEAVPTKGFSRLVPRGVALPPGQSAWRSHDGLVVVSSLEQAYLPGSGEPPLVGPQWLVTVSRRSGGIEARCRVTDDDVIRVADAFCLPAWDEDAHHPGIARHLWCPVEERWRNTCECKLSEIVVVEPSGYRWTTDRDGPCRGCEYEGLTGMPCTIHRAEA